MNTNDLPPTDEQSTQNLTELPCSNPLPVVELIDTKLTQAAPYNFPWGLLAKALAVVTTVGGLALHTMGFLSYQAYFTEWGIDPGLFPQSTDAIIINGLSALLDRTITLTSLFNTKSSLVMGLILTVSLCVYFYIDTLRKTHAPNLKLRHRPDWFVVLAKSVSISFIAVGMIPIAIVFIVIGLITPAALGENAGQSRAQHQMERYKLGCEKNVRDKCIEICKSGKVIAHGFLIEGSESHIALFDVTKNRAWAFERDGTELLVDSSNGTVQNSAKSAKTVMGKAKSALAEKKCP